MAAARSGSRQAPSSYHPVQQQPTPDRYRQIQQALADRGYFAGPVDGTWGASSSDALKRFQHDQNLTEDGKVGSLVLIALGLGPKRDGSPDTKNVSPAQPASDSVPDADSNASAAPAPPVPAPPPDSGPVPEAVPR